MSKTWLGPWRLDREAGVWRRRMQAPIVHRLPIENTNSGSPYGVTMIAFVTHSAERVLTVPDHR